MYKKGGLISQSSTVNLCPKLCCISRVFNWLLTIRVEIVQKNRDKKKSEGIRLGGDWVVYRDTLEANKFKV